MWQVMDASSWVGCVVLDRGVFVWCLHQQVVHVGVTWCGVHMRQMAVSKVAFGAVVQLQAL